MAIAGAIVLGGWAVVKVGGQPSPVPLPSPTGAVDPVFVFLLRDDADGYEPTSYDPFPRPSGGAQGAEERLEAALRELVKGPTDPERDLGYGSAFSPATAGIVEGVELRDGRAIVTFDDFRDRMPDASTTYGGSVLLMQLKRTVFTFTGVETAEFRIGASCARFWTFLQPGGCEIVHEDGSRTPRE